MRDLDSMATDMMQLYNGLDRYRGSLLPPKKYETFPDNPNTLEHWQRHLNGTVGLGINPLRDDGTVVWGALDIDRHKTGDQPIDIAEMAMKVQQLGLPLLCFASKSKGSMHMHLLLSEPCPAALIVRLLKMWAAQLGEAGCEVFPKQTKLMKGAAGNWLNLPYHNYAETARYCYHSDTKLSLEEYIELAKSKQISLEQVKQYLLAESKGELADAPPCVEYFLTKGLNVGGRNEGIFTIATYLRRKHEDDWKERVTEINFDKSITEKPLPTQQLNTLIRSVDKGGYTKYRCNQPPMCDHCDKDLCVTRKFGVGPDGPSKVYGDTPNWGTLTKIMTDPPKYELGVNGKLILFSDVAELMSAKKVRERILASCNMLIPPMKDADWQPILADKLESMEEESAPADAGPAAIVGAMLDRFLHQAERYNAEGEPLTGDRKDVLRGRPVLVSEKDADNNHTRYVIIFRMADFVVFLKKNKAEEVKDANLWLILKRRFGCDHKTFRGVSSTPRSLWFREFEAEPLSFDPPPIDEKF